jgi:hypothetical protein
MRRLAFAILFSLAAVTSSAQAQDGVLALEAIARDWSRSSNPPRCEPQLSRGLPEPTRTCEWPVGSSDRGGLKVSGLANAAGKIVLVAREDDVADRAAALRLRDSLSVSMRAAGLREFRCPWDGDGRQWRSAQATVHMTIGATLPDGRISILIFATTHTDSVPEVLCSGAEAIPD